MIELCGRLMPEQALCGRDSPSAYVFAARDAAEADHLQRVNGDTKTRSVLYTTLRRSPCPILTKRSRAMFASKAFHRRYRRTR